MVPRIMNEVSGFCNMITTSDNDDPLMILYDHDEKTIDMFHYYEENGIEVSEPYMTFKVDFSKEVLEPISYKMTQLILKFLLILKIKMLYQQKMI